MKTKVLISALSLIVNAMIAQDTTTVYQNQAMQNKADVTPGKSKFMLRGYAHSGFEAVENDKGKYDMNFVGGSFAPIFMYKQSDKLFFEAELEGEYEGGVFELGLEYADINYVLNKYMMLRLGKFLLPFGTFGEKLHPAWINRLATLPLGFGHGGIAPTSDIGVELRGAGYFGNLKWNYQLYVINGPQLNDGSVDPNEAGMLNFNTINDNNNDKSIGARIGIFPFSNSSLEIGFSGLTGKVGAQNSPYENTSAMLGAIDLSFVKNISQLGVIDIKGQINYSKVDNNSYLLPDTNLYYTFNNESYAYYAQISYRPAFVNNKVIKNFELVTRYSEMQTAKSSLWGQNSNTLAFGLSYWFDWRTSLKIGYQIGNSVNNPNNMNSMKDKPNINSNIFYIHWAIGF